MQQKWGVQLVFWAKINLQGLEKSNNASNITINLGRMMNILPVVFKQICQFSTLNFSKGHTFLEILLPDLSPLWTPVLENMNLFSVQFRKGNNLSLGPCGPGPDGRLFIETSRPPTLTASNFDAL